VAPPRLEFRGVSKRFAAAGRRGEVTLAVADVSFAVQDGEVVSLIGPSGCGKSTLLHLGSGLDQPSEGEVLVDGERVSRPNPHVAIMLQKDLLLPWRTIRENVEFGLEIQGVAAAERHGRSEALLATCRIADFAGHYPYQLSGGMRQRAALARTFAIDPTVLLLDEPFSALDAQTREIMQTELMRIWEEGRKTVLFVTHQIDEAVFLSDRVLVFARRPGRLQESVEIKLPRPRALAIKRTAEFVAYVDHIWRLIEDDVRASVSEATV
jgi:NitT/TauT family transport system ATP-binding protein